MKLKNKILFFVSILAFLCACNEGGKSDVFSEDDMTSILVDIHLLEAKVVALKLKTDSAQRLYNTLEYDVLNQYNADKSYYEKSYSYYLQKTDKLEIIYDRVVDSLNVINQNAKFEEEQDKERKKREREEKKERKKAEKERLRREKEGLPSLEEIAEILENAKGEFIGPETLAVRSYQEEFEFLIEWLRQDSIATIYLDSLAREDEALLDSVQVDSTIVVFEGEDSIVIEEVEKKIWKAKPKAPREELIDSVKVEKEGKKLLKAVPKPAKKELLDSRKKLEKS